MKHDATQSTAARLSSVVSELRAINRGIPENRSDAPTMALKWWIDEAAKRTKRAQDLCGDIATTTQKGSAIGWDDL